MGGHLLQVCSEDNLVMYVKHCNLRERCSISTRLRVAHYHEHCSFELQISDHIQDINVKKDKSSMEESFSPCYFTFSKPPDLMNFKRFLEWNREVTTKEWAF